MVNFNVTNEEKAKKFLTRYCKIDLDNTDTGALTGRDAGSTVIKSENTIMQYVPVKKWANPVNSKIFTITYLDEENKPTISKEAHYSLINGLTVIYDAYDDKAEGFQEINIAIKNHIIRGMHSSWLKNALDLIETSYGISFENSESVRGSVTTNKLWIHFINDAGKSESPCWIKNYFQDFEDLNTRTVYYNQTTKELHLYLNMYYLNEMNTASPLGKLPTSNNNFNRLLVHELTHALLSANINYYYEMPDYLSEGLAELVHGIDDIRYEAILEFIKQYPEEIRQLYITGELKGNIERNPYVNQFYHVAGYLILRFFIEQTSEYLKDEDNEEVELDEEILKIIEKSSNDEGYGSSFLVKMPTNLYKRYSDALSKSNAIMVVQAGKYKMLAQTEKFIQIRVRNSTPIRVNRTVISKNMRQDFGCFGDDTNSVMDGWIDVMSGTIFGDSFDQVPPSNTGSLAGNINPSAAGVTPVTHKNSHLTGYFSDYFDSYILNLATGSVISFHMPPDLSDTVSANFESQNVRGRSSQFHGYNDTGPRNIAFSIELQADFCKEDLHVTLAKLKALAYPVYTDGVVYPSALIKLGDVISGEFIINSVGISYDGDSAPVRDYLYTKANVSIDATEVPEEARSATYIERDTNYFHTPLDLSWNGIKSWFNNKVIGTIKDQLGLSQLGL